MSLRDWVHSQFPGTSRAEEIDRLSILTAPALSQAQISAICSDRSWKSRPAMMSQKWDPNIASRRIESDNIYLEMLQQQGRATPKPRRFEIWSVNEQSRSSGSAPRLPSHPELLRPTLHSVWLNYLLNLIDKISEALSSERLRSIHLHRKYQYYLYCL